MALADKFDKAYEDKSLAELADAPVAALQGVSDGDAGWCWVRVRGRVIERDRAGAVVRIAGTALNVNATREAERERQDIGLHGCRARFSLRGR